MYSAGAALLEALSEAGVSYLFANLGSDHPALMEALADSNASSRPAPKLITCPNEMVALSAAQGYTQATGQPQAVLVHVECGTQGLAGAVHNAARCRVPVLILAGASPFTQEGEFRGSRNEFIHWLQDVRDQRGIVRGYVKFDAELRTGRNLKQMVHRALQIACSDPQGPAYLVCAREVLEEELRTAEPGYNMAPIAPAALTSDAAAAIAAELAAAARPLVVTSYLGRQPRAVEELVSLCRFAGLGVVESAPSYLNYPATDEMYQGFYANEPQQSAVLADADVILILDSDVPWIPMVNRPRQDARIYHIDVDPLKESMTLWMHPARQSFRADAATALAQIREKLEQAGMEDAAVRQRRAHYKRLHEQRRSSLLARERVENGVITPEYLTTCVRQAVDGEAIVLNEGITNYRAITEHMARTLPGTFFTSGGSSLGWNGGAAVGIKLAHPDRMVVSLTGDGSYLFSIPSTVHWMARRYQTPFLQIIFNNRGWRSPKLSAIAVHPEGHASKGEDIGVSFDPSPDYSGIAAAAGGAFARTVRTPGDLEEALCAALKVISDEKRAAVLDVWLPHL